MLGPIGRPGRGTYASSKLGLDGFTVCLAAEVASDQILVNCVAPGLIDTDMSRRLGPEQLAKIVAEIPIGRPARPGEVAALVAFLAGPENTYITGQNIIIDGGYTRLKL